MLNNQKLEKELAKLYHSDMDFVHKLLKYDCPLPLLSKDGNNNTVLHCMILNKDYKGIDLFLANILNSKLYESEYRNQVLNSQNNQRNTPMHLAVLGGLQNVAKRLGKVGVNLTLPNKDDFIVRLSESQSDSRSNSNSSGRPRLSDISNLSDIETSVNNNLVNPFTLSLSPVSLCVIVLLLFQMKIER
jgi:ankyrin repeat protein